MSKHTPGSIESDTIIEGSANRKKCGCRWNKDFLYYCPTHTAAPGMAEVCKMLIGFKAMFPNIATPEDPFAVDATSPNSYLETLISKARALLARIEGEG